MLFYIVIQKGSFQIFHTLPENQGNSFHSVKVYLCKECRIRRALIRKTMTEILTHVHSQDPQIVTGLHVLFKLKHKTLTASNLNKILSVHAEVSVAQYEQ